MATPTKTPDLPQAIVDVLVDHLGVDPEEITRDSRIVEDLGADSLDVVELAMAFEDLYHIETRDQWVDAGIIARLTVGEVLADLQRWGAKV